MPDQNVRMKTEKRDAFDIATELTIALIKAECLLSVDDAKKAFQDLFDVAYYAPTNTKNPSE